MHERLLADFGTETKSATKILSRVSLFTAATTGYLTPGPRSNIFVTSGAKFIYFSSIVVLSLL